MMRIVLSLILYLMMHGLKSMTRENDTSTSLAAARPNEFKTDEYKMKENMDVVYVASSVL